MSDFLRETSVAPVGEGLYRGHVAPEWNIGENPNGGYLMAIAVRALRQTLAHPDPLSVTAHYLRPGIADAECEVKTQVIRTGRTLSSARATLVQEGKERLELLCAFGDLSAPGAPAPAPEAPASQAPAHKAPAAQAPAHEAPAAQAPAHKAPVRLTLAPPQTPPPEDCVARSGFIQGIDLPIGQRLDMRLHPEQAMAGGASQAEVTGWLRFRDGAEPSTDALLLFVDAFPPSMIPVLGNVGWVPTIELTVHVRRRPAPGWIQGRLCTEDLDAGRMIESACLWDSEGQLVAQSRQLGLVLQNG